LEEMMKKMNEVGIVNGTVWQGGVGKDKEGSRTKI
jgi:hypothetical protein